MVDKLTRRASPDTYRVIGYDQYDYCDHFVDEFDDLNKALRCLEIKRSVPNATPTSFSDIYFIYNDKGECLYRASYHSGVKKLI